MKKIGENNQKVGKISRFVSQSFAPNPKHDKIWARWASNILSKSLRERV